MTTLILAGVLALVGLSAAGVARRAFVELVLIGCNDDWASRASNLAELLAHDPDVIFIQEGKAADYRELTDEHGRRLLPFHAWGVHQDTTSPARAGSVVIYRHQAFDRTGGGWTFAVHAHGLLARWIAWLRGRIGGRRVFLFSAHRPPQRTRHWWRPFDLALWARLRHALAARRLVIGQMDSNQHGGPPRLPKRLRWVAVGKSIDGFILDRRITVVDGPTELPKNTSDHHPIKLRVRIPVPANRRRNRAH